MSDEVSQFDFDVSYQNRNQLLGDAIAGVRIAKGYFGNEDNDAARALINADNDLQLLEKMKEDYLEVQEPVVYPVTVQAFLKKGFEVPTDFSLLTEKFNFYWVEFPVALFTKTTWRYDKLELLAVFSCNSEVKEPKAFRIFPPKEFQQILRVSGKLDLGLDANGQLNVAVKQIDLKSEAGDLKAKADAEAKAHANANLVFGPFSYTWKRAVLDYQGEKMRMVKWRFNDIDVEYAAQPIVIMQVSKDAKEFKVAVSAQASRNPDEAPDGLKNQLHYLKEKVLAWWNGGTPNQTIPKTYDLLS